MKMNKQWLLKFINPYSIEVVLRFNDRYSMEQEWVKLRDKTLPVWVTDAEQEDKPFTHFQMSEVIWSDL